MPDGVAAWYKKGFRKKKLDSMSPENLNHYLIESAQGELTHWLAYALVINLPCILVQHYNRPRIKLLLHKLNDKPGEMINVT